MWVLEEIRGMPDTHRNSEEPCSPKESRTASYTPRVRTRGGPCSGDATWTRCRSICSSATWPPQTHDVHLQGTSLYANVVAGLEIECLRASPATRLQASLRREALLKELFR